MSTRPEPDLDAFLATLRGKPSAPALHRIAEVRAHLHRAARRHLGPRDRLRLVMDSEDLSQDALLALLDAAPGFRGQSWGEFLAFASAVLARQAHAAGRHHGAARRDPRRALAREEGQGAASAPSPSQHVAHAEQVAQVRALLDRLPPTLAEAVRLRVLESREYDEIAEALGITEQAVRQRVSRAIGALRDLAGGSSGGSAGPGEARGTPPPGGLSQG